jgi:hypothetical protein
VEFLVAGSVGVLCVGALVAFSMFSSRSLLAMGNYTDMDAQARIALDTLTKEIRQAIAVTGYTTNGIALKDYDGQTLQFGYDPVARKLNRTKKGTTAVLLKDCDALSFTLLGREPNDGTFDLEVTTTPAQCKAVFVTWNCSRKFVDAKLNTANMNTATIVLRMK